MHLFSVLLLVIAFAVTRLTKNMLAFFLFLIIDDIAIIIISKIKDFSSIDVSRFLFIDCVLYVFSCASVFFIINYDFFSSMHLNIIYEIAVIQMIASIALMICYIILSFFNSILLKIIKNGEL